MLHIAARPWQAVSGAYERVVSLVTMLCRLGALLAVLQLTAWVGSWTLPASLNAAEQQALTQQRIAAVESVVDASVVGIVRTSPFNEARPTGNFEILLRAIRELSRTLLWGVVAILIPIAIVAGLLSPFVRGADGYRMFFGMVAILGLLPLTAAEAAPVLGVDYLEVPMPVSLLAGIAAPLVAGALLISAAVLFSSRGQGRGDTIMDGANQHISRSELETIIRRGERIPDARSQQIRSSRSRKRTQ